MSVRRWMLVMLLGERLCLSSSVAAEPRPTNAPTVGTRSPRVATTNAPASRPADATTNLAKAFQVKNGFRMELVASEPLVVDPIAMAFDEKGRLFVVESHRAYLGASAPGRVRLLEDTDGDGKFDASSVYADNLEQPSAIACYDGGVFVACGSQILFLKDTDGEGVADVRRVAFTCYGDAERGDQSVNVTCLAWGLDNRIHAGTSTSGGSVSAAAPAKGSIELTDGNFAFDPRTFQLEAESGVAPTGLCFDDWGRKFVCSSGDHIVQVMYDAAGARRAAGFSAPGPLLDIAASGPATPIFPLRPAASGFSPSRFSSATGLTIYRGDAFPLDYVGDAFVADTEAGIIHHEKLRPNGLQLVAERPRDEPGIEFVASRDPSFRPMQIVNAPDGALYVADQTAGSAELSIATTGTAKAPAPKATAPKIPSGRGRIYRIAPVGFKTPKVPQLATAKAVELVAALESRNGWRRDTAARLLYERQDRIAIAPLVGLLMDPGSPPISRVHALHALDGLGALVESHVLKGLIDADERVREHALRLAVRFIGTNGEASDLLWNQLGALTADPSIQVRYQLAFTLGKSRNPGRVRLLADLLRRDFGNRWMQCAVISLLGSGAGEMFGIIATDPAIRNTPGGDETLEQLLFMVGAAGQPDELTPIFKSLASLPNSAATFRLMRVLGDGLQHSGTALKTADPTGILRPLYARAGRIASDYTAPEAMRIEAILLFGTTSYAECGTALIGMLNLASPQGVQVAAITTLEQFNDPAIAPGLLRHWGLLSRGGRAEAIVALLSRPERTRALLAAMEIGEIRATDVTSSQANILIHHPDPDIRQRAVKLLGSDLNTQRQAVVGRFIPATQMGGNATHGRNIFMSRCGACHQLAGAGTAAGIDLTYAARGNRETVLTKVIDPNRDVDSNYPFSLIETTDGETLAGFILTQSPAVTTLCQTTGSIREVPRSRMGAVQNLPGSAMPEGLESGLSQQDMADLLEYLADTAPLNSESTR